MTIDPTSNVASVPRPRERFDVAVVGAGSSGCAAALAAVQAGARVLLVDENPLPPGMMGLDVPLRYGGRATAAVQNQARMIERIVAAEPLLAEAFDAGVDVRLGMSVWGAWVPGPANRALGDRLIGLADEQRSWLIGFDELVVAAGARDLSFGFAGADLPGVVGALGFISLLRRYDAFAGRRIAVLGQGALAEHCSELARTKGLDVAVVTQGHVPLRADGDANGVTALTVVAAHGGGRQTLTCDTVVLAVGIVPNIELPAVLGCALTFDAARGGHIPVLDSLGRTSLPFVRVVGDAAGVDCGSDWLDWLGALRATGADAVLACLCEEVSRADLLGVHPPRYLGAGTAGQAPLDPGAPPNPDHIKRLTRAGMGVCQGRRCREQVAGLLALDAGVSLAAVPLASYRMPLRPLPMTVLAPDDEPDGMQDNWRIWFDIPSMFTDHRDILAQDTV